MILIWLVRRLALLAGFGAIMVGSLVGMEPGAIFVLAIAGWWMLYATRGR
jgi:hypothetical protein